MRALLHILTKSNDAVAAEIIEEQRRHADQKVNAMNLTTPEPDYDLLLEAIFAADVVAVW
jgi:hypothetical protein